MTLRIEHAPCRDDVIEQRRDDFFWRAAAGREAGSFVTPAALYSGLSPPGNAITMHSHQHWLEVVQRAPLVSIDLIVRDSHGRVLLGLRSNRPARDTWFVPGGVIRKGESIDQAFSRIATVELGRPLPRSDASFRGVYEHFYEDNFAGAPDIGTHYVVLAYQITVPDLDERGSLDQHRELRLFTPRQLLADTAVHENTKAYFINQ